MSFRDDHDAALARADAAVREARLLAEDNERLQAELAHAREWLGGPRIRQALAAAAILVCAGLAIGGVLYGRSSVDCPALPPPASKLVPLPQVYGVIVADGPEVGHWTMNASRCIPRDIGVELTSVGSDDHSVGIIGNDVEIETPTGTLTLERTHCYARRTTEVHKTDDTPPMYDGTLELDCQFRGNTVQGRIEFRHCR